MADSRFIVFGCRPEDDLLVENHTDDFESAIAYALETTTAEFKARVWDRESRKFLSDRTVGYAVLYYGGTPCVQH